MKKKFVITVDLGGTKILSALINSKKKIEEKVKIPTDAEKGTEFLVECIADSVKKLLKKSKRNEKEIAALCLGVPGTVNPNSGIISIAPNLNIVDFNIKKSLQKYFDIPVLLENDVNMAALGIKSFEYNDKVNNMLVVFVGTGIGGALLFNGEMYRGSSFFAGEIGHMKIRPSGSFAVDNNDLTFENYASRTAMVNSIIQRAKKEETVLKDFIKSGKKIKSKSLSKALDAKDKVITEEMEKGCKAIGTVLGSLTTLLNLDTIVLGGGVVEANEDFMIPRIKKAFSKSVISSAGRIVKIKATKLGDDAPLFGGYALAEEFLKD